MACASSEWPQQLGECFPFRRGFTCLYPSNRWVTFLLENRQKWSVYEFGDARLSQWNTVVVFRVVRCPVFTRPPWSRSWPSWPFGSDKVTRSDY